MPLADGDVFAGFTIARQLGSGGWARYTGSSALTRFRTFGNQAVVPAKNFSMAALTASGRSKKPRCPVSGTCR